MGNQETISKLRNALIAFRSVVDDVPAVVSEEILKASILDEPRVPHRTGDLASSGGAYSSGRLSVTSEELGDSNAAIAVWLNPDGKYADDGRVLQAQGLSDSIYRKPPSVLGTGQGDGAIAYFNPIATVMHEWKGGFSEYDAGPHFLSSKGAIGAARAASKLKMLAVQRGKR